MHIGLAPVLFGDGVVGPTGDARDFGQSGDALSTARLDIARKEEFGRRQNVL